MFAYLTKYKSTSTSYKELVSKYSKIDHGYEDLIQTKYIAHRPLHKLYIGFTSYKVGNKYFCVCVTLDGFNNEIVHYDIANNDKPESIFKSLEEHLQYLLQYKRVGEETIIHFVNKWQFNTEFFRDACQRLNIKMSISKSGNKDSNLPYVGFFTLFANEFAYMWNFSKVDHFEEGAQSYIEDFNESMLVWRVFRVYDYRAIRGWTYNSRISKKKYFDELFKFS